MSTEISLLAEMLDKEEGKMGLYRDSELHPEQPSNPQGTISISWQESRQWGLITLILYDPTAAGKSIEFKSRTMFFLKREHFVFSTIL